jgi:hypothetical protein
MSTPEGGEREGSGGHTIEPAAYESRSLDLKGLSEPVPVRVIHL